MLKNYVSRFKSALHSAATFQASPAKLATATFVGTLIGVSPFYGFHLLLCLGFSAVLRLNAILTYAAANISNPFFAPFLTFASYQVGSYLLTNDWGTLSWDAVKDNPSVVFKSWLIGSILLGSVLGLILAIFVYMLSRAWRGSDPDRDSMRVYATRIADAAKPFGRFASGYARGKILGDPVYRRLLELIPGGKSVLDLGGGQGFLTLLLAQKHTHALGPLVVLDHDERKLAQGALAANTLALAISFKQGDVRAPIVGAYDVICLIDVLHYFQHPEQDVLIKSAASALNPNGVLYIREIDFDGSTRSWLNYLQETFSLHFGITRANALHPRCKRDLLQILKKEGLVCSTEACSGGLLYKNMLIFARRS